MLPPECALITPRVLDSPSSPGVVAVRVERMLPPDCDLVTGRVLALRLEGGVLVKAPSARGVLGGRLEEDRVEDRFDFSGDFGESTSPTSPLALVPVSGSPTRRCLRLDGDLDVRSSRFLDLVTPCFRFVGSGSSAIA